MTLPVKTPITQIAIGSAVDPTTANQPHLDLEQNIDDIRAFLAGSGFNYFDNDTSTTTGLTFGYFGGLINHGGVSAIIADGTTLLTASSTNYVYALDSTGWTIQSGLSVPVGAILLYTVTTDLSTITGITDERSLINSAWRHIDTRLGHLGDVGVGTVDPAVRLHIAEGISGAGAELLRIQNTTGNQSVKIALYDDTIEAANIEWTNSLNALYLRSLSGYVRFYSNNTLAFDLDSSQNAILYGQSFRIQNAGTPIISLNNTTDLTLITKVADNHLQISTSDDALSAKLDIGSTSSSVFRSQLLLENYNLYVGGTAITLTTSDAYVRRAGTPTKLLAVGDNTGTASFTASDTWVVPDGVYIVFVTIVGGGQGGQGGGDGGNWPTGATPAAGGDSTVTGSLEILNADGGYCVMDAVGAISTPNNAIVTKWLNLTSAAVVPEASFVAYDGANGGSGNPAPGGAGGASIFAAGGVPTTSYGGPFAGMEGTEGSGGAGGAGQDNLGGAGGGAGAGAIAVPFHVVPGETLTIAIGAGSAGTVSTSGSHGNGATGGDGKVLISW